MSEAVKPNGAVAGESHYFTVEDLADFCPSPGLEETPAAQPAQAPEAQASPNAEYPSKETPEYLRKVIPEDHPLIHFKLNDSSRPQAIPFSDIRAGEERPEAVAEDREWLERLNAVKDTVRSYWPMYWPLFEACLSAYVSLLLKDVRQGIGLILVGPSGSGKGTVLETFQGAGPTVWRDKFTPASLLSGFADGESKKADVEERALFKAVKHRALMVGDLAPIFRGDDAKKAMFNVIPGWMDGNGLKYDTGTHGAIGEKGDFSFVMIGGTTPFGSQMWHLMSTVGPRFLFLRVVGPSESELIAKELYQPAKLEIGSAIASFLNWVFERHAPRTEDWPMTSPDIDKMVTNAARLMARGQTLRSYDGGIVRPTSNHLYQRLGTLLAGRALLWRRGELDDTDLRLAERVVRSSAPGARGRVLLAIAGGTCEATKIEAETHVPYDTVQTTLKDLETTGLVRRAGTVKRDERGQPAIAWELAPVPSDPEDEALRAEYSE